MQPLFIVHALLFLILKNCPVLLLCFSKFHFDDFVFYMSSLTLDFFNILVVCFCFIDSTNHVQYLIFILRDVKCQLPRHRSAS